MNTNDGISLLQSILPLLVPILLIQFGLLIYCLIDLSRRERTRGPKWLWALVIIFVNIIGPIIYLLVGREE